MSSDGTDAECCVSAVLVIMMKAVCQVMEQMLNAVSLLSLL